MKNVDTIKERWYTIYVVKKYNKNKSERMMIMGNIGDFKNRNLIGVKSMIEEIEEDYEIYKEARNLRNMQWEDFKRECDQIAYMYIERGLPEDLAEDVARNPKKSIERLHDGSYAEYWEEMARSGHYREIEYKYSIANKWNCKLTYWFETLQEAKNKIAELEKNDRKFRTYEEGYYRIIDLKTGKAV